MKTPVHVVCLLAFFSAFAACRGDDEGFDVRQHLSTVTRYDAVKDTAFNGSEIPESCEPIHLNLVARHGTRLPSRRIMRELDELSARLKVLISVAEERRSALPSWLRGWKSPWTGNANAGELLTSGENELYGLGTRTRENFPGLFDKDYHPDLYPIRATQIPRTSASGVAFGLGIFRGKGTLGPLHQRAFGVTTETRKHDIWLRFHECCQNYKIYKESEKAVVDEVKQPVLDEITSSLVGRYKLNFTRQDTHSLWFLCKQEASLLDLTDQACGLFTPSEVKLLEWTDDVETFILEGYGKPINYRMASPLLEDVVLSMEAAIRAKEENLPRGSYETAKLRFAHAETIIPFSCLLGLFRDGSELEQLRRKQPLELPPKPPQNRKWRSSVMAPFASNNMLVLHSCPATKSKYFVQVLHNERPIPLPGCNGSDLCPFNDFKERIVAPNMKPSFKSLCNTKDTPEPSPPSGIISLLTRWLSPYLSPEKSKKTSRRYDL